MSYTPPEDINFQILTKNCSRHHAFIAYRSQNCDKIIIFDFVLFKKKTKVPIFSRLHSVNSVEARKNGDFCFFVILFIMKMWLITDLYIFANEYTRVVAHLGLESTVSWSMRTKYLNLMVKHTYHVCATYLTVRLAQLCVLSVTTVRFYAGGRYKYLIDVNLTTFFLIYVVIPHVYQYARKIM